MNALSLIFLLLAFAIVFELGAAMVLMCLRINWKFKLVMASLAMLMVAILYDAYQAALVADERGQMTNLLGPWWFFAVIGIVVILGLIESKIFIKLKRNRK